MRTGVTLCSGGGGSALGLLAAGVQPVGAVEYDAAIAAQYAANLGPHVLVQPLQETDFRQWIGVDVLQDSNPCPNFSNAKQGGEETPNDLTIAEATCRAIRTIRPRAFWLENVEGYAKSESYRRIRAALDDLDYWSDAQVVNAADYGVPQTRRRLILRAVAGGWMQPFRPLPAPVPWVGWYAAIADLVDTLPVSEFAPWQLKRLPDLLASTLVPGANDFRPQPATKPAITVTGNADRMRAFLVSNAATEWGDGLRTADEPMLSVTGQTAGRVRAFLVNSSNSAGGAGIAVYDLADPVPTVRTGMNHRPSAFIVDRILGSRGTVLQTRQEHEPMWTLSTHADQCTSTRAWLEQGRVVKMTPRALARFQAFPDSYALPVQNALACRILGNAVPPLLAQRITESLLDGQAVGRAA